MHQRYLVTILPADRPLPPPLVSAPAHRAAYTVGHHCVIIDAPDTPLGDGLHIDATALPRRLTLTEGTIIPSGGRDWPQSGTYNQLIISADGQARLHNDSFGLLAGFFAQANGALYVSNSMRLLRHGAGLGHDELGIAAMYLFAGWTPSERTILRDGRRMTAGTEYHFRLDSAAPPAVNRLGRTWTDVIDRPLARVVDDICDLWQAAVARHFDPIDTPIGLLLSGGLDSRMVAGGVAARGKPLIGLTHGDLHSDEVRIAGEVAAVVGATWLPFGLDETYDFERLDFDRVNYTNETMYNLMWYDSGPGLNAAGVTHFTTGATFETTFGGQRDANARQRLLKNLRQSFLGPWRVPPATPADVDALTEATTAQARKRARNFARLLVEPYRSLMTDSLPAIRDEVGGRMRAIAAAGPIAPGQIRERFDSEQYQMHHSRDLERQLVNFGQLALPTCDRDLADYLTNLPAGMKYDHALYYRVFRRLYPRLAAIQVPNLNTDIDKPQWRIELSRAWNIQRQTRLTPWVNFSQWLTLGDNLARYERLFLEQPHFFDGAAVREFFAAVRAGRLSLYDGAETTGFLNLSYLLDERRAAVRPSPGSRLEAGAPTDWIAGFQPALNPATPSRP